MKNTGYRLVYAFLWLLTLPPLRVLYIISDALFFINYYFIKYRKKVVIENLRNAFPDKSEKEIDKIARSFYHHLSDFLIESVKSIHLTKKQADKHMTFKNISLLDELYHQGKDIALISGHYGNWEWANNLPTKIKHKAITIYHPLNNKISDKLINDQRSKFGMIMVPMNMVLREAVNHMQRNERIAIWYLGDQRPPKNNKFWTLFLNQDTAFYLGAEKMAVKYNQAVVFMDIQKVKRGFYEMEFRLLFKDGANTCEFEITKTQAKVLEEIIRNKPEYWLWSHRRWKHKRPENIKNA